MTTAGEQVSIALDGIAEAIHELAQAVSESDAHTEKTNEPKNIPDTSAEVKANSPWWNGAQLVQDSEFDVWTREEDGQYRMLRPVGEDYQGWSRFAAEQLEHWWGNITVIVDEAGYVTGTLKPRH